MKKHPDYILLGAAAGLLILGILILASVSSSISEEKFGNTYYFLNHQMLFGLLPGVFLAFVVFRIPIAFFKKWGVVFLLINLVLMGMVFLPLIGLSTGGAARWLRLGPFTFQPSEFLKLTFLIYLSLWLANRIPQQQGKSSLEKIKRNKELGQTFIVFLIIIGIVSLLLILQPDISTLGIIVFSATLMYFLANTPLWHILLIFLFGIGGLFSIIKIAPYRASRILVFLNPNIDPMGMGYQIKQSLITIGSGGIFGLGLGLSGQKYGFLPQSMSDSIFAVFSEEAGFVGALILILFFLLFLWRGFKIARESQDKFSQLLAGGITSWIIIQAFVNISSMIGILPLSGIPLPFISYGGSALVIELIGVGLLLNISRNI